MNCETPGRSGWRFLSAEPERVVAEVVGRGRRVASVGALSPNVISALSVRGCTVVGELSEIGAEEPVDVVVVPVPGRDPEAPADLAPALATAAEHVEIGASVVIVVEGGPGRGARPEPVVLALATTPFLAVGVRSVWALAPSADPIVMEGEAAWCVVEAVFTGTEGLGALWGYRRALESELDAERLARGLEAHRAERARAEAEVHRADARAARDELDRLRATRLFRWTAPGRAVYSRLRRRRGGL